MTPEDIPTCHRDKLKRTLTIPFPYKEPHTKGEGEGAYSPRKVPGHIYCTLGTRHLHVLTKKCNTKYGSPPLPPTCIKTTATPCSLSVTTTSSLIVHHGISRTTGSETHRQLYTTSCNQHQVLRCHSYSILGSTMHQNTDSACLFTQEILGGN